MKKLISLLLIFFSMLTSNVSAYSILNVSNNSVKYESEFKKKIDFSKIKMISLNNLNKKINILIKKTEDDTNKSDDKKEKLLGQLVALSNLINNELKNREISSKITITIIDDNRCTNCVTKEITKQLKQVPFFIQAKFIEKEFSETGVSDYLKQNNIKNLPAVILSTKDINDNGGMQPYLKELADKQYSLDVGSTFDPFITRSNKGFQVLDKEIIKKIKDNTYLKGNKDAKISWIEYSDLECPFCAKLHNSDVPTKIKDTYGDKVNKYFNNYPLSFHKNAMSAARVIECIGEQKGSDAFYSLIDIAYSNQKSDESYLVEESIKLGADKATLEKCITDGKYDEKIKNEESLGVSTFSISGTPASILINNETGEYEVIAGAYPFEKFNEIIDALLK